MIDILKNFWTFLIESEFVKNSFLVFLTAFLSYFWSSIGLRREQRIRFEEKIGAEIANSLSEVRELVTDIGTVEVFNPYQTFSEAKDIGDLVKCIRYPAFMNDLDSLYAFQAKVTDYRAKNERYLDLLSAAYLYVLERYLLNLCVFVGQKHLKEQLPIAGLMVICDTVKWEKAFDAHIVRQINHPHRRLFTRYGFKWKIAKRYVERKYLYNTKLQEAMTGKPNFQILLDTLTQNEEPEYANV